MVANEYTDIKIRFSLYMMYHVNMFAGLMFTPTTRVLKSFKNASQLFAKYIELMMERNKKLDFGELLDHILNIILN